MVLQQKQWLNYLARGDGSLQARGLKDRSSSPSRTLHVLLHYLVSNRQPGVFEHSRHSVWLLRHLNSVWCFGGSQQKGAGSQVWGKGSVIRDSGSRIRGAGSEVRRDPPILPMSRNMRELVSDILKTHGFYCARAPVGPYMGLTKWEASAYINILAVQN